MSFGNNRLQEAMRRVEEYRAKQAAAAAMGLPPFPGNLVSQPLAPAPPVAAPPAPMTTFTPPPPVPANQLPNLAEILAASLPVSAQAVPYMTPEQVATLARRAALPPGSPMLTNAQQIIAPQYQREANAAMMADLAGQMGAMNLAGQQHQQDYQAMLPALQAEQQRAEQEFPPGTAGAILQQSRTQPTGTPWLPDAEPPEFADPFAPQKQELQGQIDEATLANMVAEARGVTGDQEEQEWNAASLQLNEEAQSNRAMLGQVSLAIEKGEAPEFYQVEYDGVEYQLTPLEYQQVLQESVTMQDAVLDSRETVRSLSFYGVPPEGVPSWQELLLSPLTAVGALADLPRQWIGRPLFGTALYLLAGSAQLLPGDLGEGVVQTMHEEGPTAVWEKHIAGAKDADNLMGILYHTAINLVSDPLTYIGIGAVLKARYAARASTTLAQATSISQMAQEGVDVGTMVARAARPGTVTDDMIAAMNQGVRLSDQDLVTLIRTSGLSPDMLDVIRSGSFTADDLLRAASTIKGPTGSFFPGTQIPLPGTQATQAWSLPELEQIAQHSRGMANIFNLADTVTSIPGLAVWKGGSKVLGGTGRRLLGPLLQPGQTAIRRQQTEGLSNALPLVYEGIDATRAEALQRQPEMAAALIDLPDTASRRSLLGFLPPETRFSLISKSPKVLAELNLGTRGLRQAPEGLADLGDDRVWLATAPRATARTTISEPVTAESLQSRLDELEARIANEAGAEAKATRAELRRVRKDMASLQRGETIEPTVSKGRTTTQAERMVVYNQRTDEVEVIEIGRRTRDNPTGRTVLKSLPAEDWLEEAPLREVLQEALPGMTEELSSKAAGPLLSSTFRQMEDVARQQIKSGEKAPFKFTKPPGGKLAPPEGFVTVLTDEDKGIRVIRNLADNSLTSQVYKGGGIWDNVRTIGMEEVAGPRKIAGGDYDRLFTGTNSTADNFTNRLYDQNPTAWQNTYNRVKGIPSRKLMDYRGGKGQTEHKVFELLYASDVLTATSKEIGSENLPNWTLREVPGGGFESDRWIEEAAFNGSPKWEVPNNQKGPMSRGALGGDVTKGTPDWKVGGKAFKTSDPDQHKVLLNLTGAKQEISPARASQLIAKKLTPEQIADEFPILTVKSLQAMTPEQRADAVLNVIWYRGAKAFDPSTLGDKTVGHNRWVYRRAYDKARIQIAEAYLGRDLTFGEIQELYRFNELTEVTRHIDAATTAPIKRGTPEGAAEELLDEAVEGGAAQPPAPGTITPDTSFGTPPAPPGAPVTGIAPEGEAVPDVQTELMGRQSENVPSGIRGALAQDIRNVGERLGYGQRITLDDTPVNPNVTAPQGSYDVVAMMRETGRIAEEDVGVLNQAVPNDPLGRSVIDVILEAYDNGMSKDDALAMLIKEMGLGQEYRHPVSRFWDKLGAFFRDSIMYPLWRGPLPGMIDALTDATMMAATGHTDLAKITLRDISRNSKAFLRAFASKETRGQARELMLKPLNDHNRAFADAAGITIRERYTHAHALKMGDQSIPATDFSAKVTDLPAEEQKRIQSQLYQTTPESMYGDLGRKVAGETGASAGRKVASVIHSSGSMRAFRVMIDDVKRSLMFTHEYVRFHDQAVQELVQRARNVASSLGMAPEQVETVINQVAAEHWNRLAPETKQIMDTYFPGWRPFEPEELLQAFGGQGAAKDMARFWRGQMRRLQTTAEKSTDDLMFSYLPTKLDEGVQKFVFFHYWTSRALHRQLKVYFDNPIVQANMYRMYEGLKNQADRDPSLPWYLKWSANVFTSPYGAAAMVSPVVALVPFAVAMDAASATDDRKKIWDRVSTYVMVQPLVQAIAATTGLSDEVPDITATGALRRQVIAGMNLLKAYGLMPNGYEPTDDAIQDNITALINLARTNKYVATDIVRGGEPIRRPSRGDYDRRRIAYYMSEVMRERGIDPDSEEAYDYWADFNNSHSSDVYKEAFRRFAIDLAQGQVVRMFIPTQTYYKPGAEIEQTAREGREAESAGTPMTDEQAEANFIWGQARTGSPQASQLNLELHGRDQIGTANMRETYEAYNDFAYDDLEQLQEKYGTGVSVNIGEGTSFSMTDWAGLSQTERLMYLDQWLINIGESREHHAYTMARKAYEDEHPLLSEFTEYQRDIGDASEISGEEAVAMELAKNSPSFADWMAGEDNRAEFDISKAIYSPDAFLAQRGDRPTIYDVISPEASDPTQVSGIQQMLGTGVGTGQESFFTKPFDEQTTDEKVQTINKALHDYQLDMTRYNEQVAALLPPGQDPAIWGAPGTPWYEATLGKQLRLAGIQIPAMPEILNAYTLWAQQALGQGIEPTPLNYVKWYEGTFGASPLVAPIGVQPTAAPPGA